MAFPGGPGLASARMSPFWISLELRIMEVVSGDNWSYKTCIAPAKSSPPTSQHPAFYRPDALPVAQPLHWSEYPLYHDINEEHLIKLHVDAELARGREPCFRAVSVWRRRVGGVASLQLLHRSNLRVPLLRPCHHDAHPWRHQPPAHGPACAAVYV